MENQSETDLIISQYYCKKEARGVTGSMVDIVLPVGSKSKKVTGEVPFYSTKLIELKRSIALSLL